MSDIASLRGRLQLQIHDLWHAGGGRGHGHALDAVVVVTPQGLPYLPGRQLRGLWRDAVQCLEAWGHVPEGTTLRIFGGDADAGRDDGGRRERRDGQLSLSSARLSADEEAWLCSPEGRSAVPHLFTEVFTTAINADGVALDHSLRGAQMMLPMALRADVELSSTDPAQAKADWEALQRAAMLVQQVGASRSRGAGRATLTLHLWPHEPAGDAS
jgi:hypothetical protein